MNKVLSIAWKDIRVRFSNRSEILFFLVLPLVFTFILRWVSFGAGQSEPGLPLLIVDEDESQRSAEIVAGLEASGSVRPEVLARAEAEQRFDDEDASALLIIPSGFEQALMSGQPGELELQEAPNDLDALALEQSVRAAAGTAGRALGVANASVAEAERLRPFDSETERQAYFEASLAQAQELVGTAPPRVEVTQPVVVEQESSAYDPTAQASAGQLITWVFIPLLGTSEMFAFERARGTLRRLLTTPTRSATFLLGAITGQLGLSIVQMTILVAFAAVAMHLIWSHSLLALAVVLLAFALAAVAFGTMLGTFVKTESQASGLSIMLGMAMALLGGCWYPIELFPEAARTAVQVLPTTWAMQGLTDLSMRGLGLVDILPEAGVLLGFAAVFFVIGIWRFKYE